MFINKQYGKKMFYFTQNSISSGKLTKNIAINILVKLSFFLFPYRNLYFQTKNSILLHPGLLSSTEMICNLCELFRLFMA